MLCLTLTIMWSGEDKINLSMLALKFSRIGKNGEQKIGKTRLESQLNTQQGVANYIN